ILLQYAKLNEKNQLKLDPDEEDSLAWLCLDIFIKYPATKMSTILQNNLSQFTSVCENLRNFDTQNITSSNITEILPILHQYKSKIVATSKLLSHIFKELENQCQTAAEANTPGEATSNEGNHFL